MNVVIGIVGAGVMGRGITQLAVTAGYEVRLFDTAAGAASDAKDVIAQHLARLVEKQRMTSDAADAAVARVVVAAGLGELADVAVIIETIVERLDAKRRLFAELESLVGAGCILASNTSSLSVSAIAAACRVPERVAGFHFFNPAPLMKVVEVVAGALTAPATIDVLVAMAHHFGHRPVLVRDSPGFLVNHAGRAYGTEALRIVGEGVATHADVDRVMREVAGFPMGPFELFDLTGLDVSHPVMESIYHQFHEEPRLRPSHETASRLAAGLLGRKVGRGFYTYANGRLEQPPESGVPEARPASVWVSRANPAGHLALVKWCETLPLPTYVETGEIASENALCLVTPLGEDATTASLHERLDPYRTVAVDTLCPLDRRVTIMGTPVTSPPMLAAAHGLFGSAGGRVTVIRDSPGFIGQRILCCIVNLGCEIAQQRIATPDAIDDAVRLGLGYPRGPLALGDWIGAERVMRILERIVATTGDPRYRPSVWLRRRAQLGISLHTAEA